MSEQKEPPSSQDLSPETENPPAKPTIGRRGFLLGTAGLLGAILLGRKIFEPEESEIAGGVPGEYSDFILQHDLMPKSFDAEDETERISLAINYLRRFTQALSEEDRKKGVIFSGLKVNSNENFPVAILNGWDVVDMINSFLGEISGPANSRKSDLSFDENSSEYSLLSSSSEFFWDGKTWQRKSKVIFDENLLNKGPYTLTDVELAALLIHEHTHALQDEALLQQVLKTQSSPNTLTSANLGRLIRESSSKHNSNVRDSLNIPDIGERQVLANEAQANVVAYSFIYLLTELNEVSNFPGTTLIDPHDTAVESIQINDPNFINLYQYFVDKVVDSNDSLNKDWLSKHVS